MAASAPAPAPAPAPAAASRVKTKKKRNKQPPPPPGPQPPRSFHWSFVAQSMCTPQMEAESARRPRMPAHSLLAFAEYHACSMNRVCASYEAANELLTQTNLFRNDDATPDEPQPDGNKPGACIRVPSHAELLTRFRSGFDCLDVIARQCDGVIRRDGKRGGAMPALPQDPRAVEAEHLRCYAATLWDRTVTNQGWQDLGNTRLQIERVDAGPPVPWHVSFFDYEDARHRRYVMGGLPRIWPALCRFLEIYHDAIKSEPIGASVDPQIDELATAVMKRYTEEWPLHSVHSPTLHVVTQPFTSALLAYARAAAMNLFMHCLLRDHKWLLTHRCGTWHTASMAKARDESVRRACEQACRAHNIDPNKPSVRGVVPPLKEQRYDHIVEDLLCRELTQRIAGLAAEVGVLFGGVANEVSPYAITDFAAFSKLNASDRQLFRCAAARQMDTEAYHASLHLVEMAAQVISRPEDHGPSDSDAATFWRCSHAANGYTRVPVREVKYQTGLELNGPDMHPFSAHNAFYEATEAIEAMRRVLVPDAVRTTCDDVAVDRDTKSMWSGRHAARTSRCICDSEGVLPQPRPSADDSHDAERAADVARAIARYRALNRHLRGFLVAPAVPTKRESPLSAPHNPLLEPVPYLPAEPCDRETPAKAAARRAVPRHGDLRVHLRVAAAAPPLPRRRQRHRRDAAAAPPVRGIDGRRVRERAA